MRRSEPASSSEHEQQMGFENDPTAAKRPEADPIRALPQVPRPVQRHDAGQLNLRFAALAKARIEWISRLIWASKASGVIGIGSMPCCASFSRTPGAANAVCVSWASFSTISRGVFAGANRAVQNV